MMMWRVGESEMLKLSERLHFIDHNLFEMVVLVLDEVIAQAERYLIVGGRCSGRGVFGLRCRGLQ